MRKHHDELAPAQTPSYQRRRTVRHGSGDHHKRSVCPIHARPHPHFVGGLVGGATGLSIEGREKIVKAKETWRRPQIRRMVQEYPYSTAYVAIVGYVMAFTEAVFK